MLRAHSGMSNGIMEHLGITHHTARVARDTFWDVLKLAE
jgi:hypothetical protein